ncbi:enoyl-ACP reductase FabI [Gracilimonas mengyeensis]|uniref:Enoyl-[acyl-carrier-protein] reductase [NADH] n=1 Tax=Gracilimonas mengyeensis TaxID=1302730 RepID=A0A521FAX0_9BACT|nr:enoyl-ACP reductase [Gracilimonas mengyeensis]SMO93303.1 Enoyl-[acyl-carrier-protein] reductase [NADH] [Gracilimonas mengyeensis]
MSDGYGLLKGKKGIIFGALDDRSIAWRIALACKREGADFVLTNAPIALRLGALDALGEETGAPIIPCDVTKDDEIEDLMAKTKDHLGSVDFILHAVGMSPNVRKKQEYNDLNYNWLQQTLDISAISLHRVLHHAEKSEILNDGGSVVALSYIGAQRIFSKYSDMNDAKALLESIARNYGSRLADRGIRVNTVSQAPTKTSAGTGIKGFDGMYTFADKIAPMGNPSADECADYVVTLFSDLTRKVTMQNLYHDGGFVTAGISEEMIADLEKLYADKDEE